MMRWVVPFLLVLVACDVEPRDEPTPTTTADAGPNDRDGGVRDGGADCRLGQVTCGANEFCTADGICAVRNRGCAYSADCAAGDVCVKPFVSTSTVNPGACAARPNGCSTDAECGDGRCLGVGVCGPQADRFEVSGTSPVPVLACSDDRVCGPGSVCRGTECGRCQEDDDCPRRLACGADGYCAEQPSCLSDDDCFEGNVCGLDALCARPTMACASDPGNDFASGAIVLSDGWYGGGTICGDDVDWYTVDIPHLYGAFVVVTATSAYATLDVEIDAPSQTTGFVRTLDLPNVVAFAVPQVFLDDPDGVASLYFSVATLDVNADYTVEVIADRRGCADALDMYGDRAEHALAAPPNVAFERIACPNGTDRVAVDALDGDQVIVSGAWTSSSLDVDYFLRASDGGLVTTTPTVASTSEETVTSNVLQAADRLTVEAQTRLAPTGGTAYTMSVTRDLGTREAVCQNPADLILSNGTASVMDTFTGASNLGRPACEPVEFCSGALCETYAAYDRRDRLYRVQPPMVPAVLTASVRPLDRAAARMSVALLSTCLDDASDVACNSSPLVRNGTSFEAQLTEAGPVFLMVSSDGEIEDFDFQLDVTVEPIAPPLNDACFDAAELATTGSQRVATYGAMNNDQLRQSGICGAATSGAGPDRFYRMTLGARERAAVELTGPQGGYLWAGTSCAAMTETCTTAATIETDFTQPVAITTFEPGADQTFYVAVDGLTRVIEGTWTLRTVREPQLECLNDEDCGGALRCDDYACRPIPASDVCPGQAVTLTNGFVSIQGSTGAATDDYALSCGVAGAPDVVYAVTLPAGLSDAAFRISDARFDPLLSVRRGSCTSDPAEVCVDDVRYPDVLLPEVRLEAPAAGTYYVIVDAFAGEGPFTLEIETAQ